MRTLGAQAAFARPASEPPLRAGERRRDIAPRSTRRLPTSRKPASE